MKSRVRHRGVLSMDSRKRDVRRKPVDGCTPLVDTGFRQADTLGGTDDFRLTGDWKYALAGGVIVGGACSVPLKLVHTVFSHMVGKGIAAVTWGVTGSVLMGTATGRAYCTRRYVAMRNHIVLRAYFVVGRTSSITAHHLIPIPSHRLPSRRIPSAPIPSPHPSPHITPHHITPHTPHPIHRLPHHRHRRASRHPRQCRPLTLCGRSDPLGVWFLSRRLGSNPPIFKIRRGWWSAFDGLRVRADLWNGLLQRTWRC
eukprot:NODE_1286_length_1023_cov_41.632444_g987_i0.p1 GENE.NODE_1286_length_1023_cov_41.632444_g987_i0~~NODE_1286_length_1023_cov_41.632444_g987_i0.p1  ORF type:complete len:256 (+),score=9.35 NODE_1286_length_1023_cov_41.632444_g987_i0:30-797(+)